MVGDNSITRISVKASRATFIVTHTTALSPGILLLEISALDRNCCLFVVGLVRVGTGSEGHGTTFGSRQNIFQIYQSIKGVP